ncbi:MAG: peroxide stress protein YaaA [Crocinitomicaceae bacterium]
MKVLLSPAKAINTENKIKTGKFTEPVFIEEAGYLVNKLKKFSAKKIKEMMHISDDIAQLNFDRYQNWDPRATLSDERTQAIAAFNGEAYRGFDSGSLSAEELDRAQETVRILSGLYGILKPLDVLYPYRLEMGTKWAVTPSKKNLYQFWGDKLADEINKEEKDVIVNVASNEYFKAVNAKKLKARVITPVFKEFKNGQYKVIMVFAKNARGAMARFIVQNNITDPEEIKLFNIGGYQFDSNLSTENEWVFTR